MPHFGPGPVVVGPAATGLAAAGPAARETLAGLRAVAGWPDAPRPVAADDLLPERALAGDPAAAAPPGRDRPPALRPTDPVLLDTVAAYLER